MHDRIRQFKVLVECRSFTDAAKKLRLSQPALSVALTKLEKELGTPLIWRGATYFEVTAAGQLVYDYAADAQARHQSLYSGLAELGNHKQQVRVGMIDSVATIFCDDNRLLELFEQRYSLSLMVDNSRTLLEKVRRAELDYAVVVSQPGPQVPKNIEQQMIGYEVLLDVTLAKQWYADERLISYNYGSTTYSIVEQAFKDFSLLPFQPETYSTSPEAMLRLVLAGRGHAVLPLSLVDSYVVAGTLLLYPLGRDGYVRRSLSLIYRQPHKSVAIIRQRLTKILAAQNRQAERLVSVDD